MPKNYQKLKEHKTVLKIYVPNIGDSKYVKYPGQVAQLARALSWYTKAVGSISGQGTYKKQPMNA